MFYLFPYNLVRKGSSVILYGAGEVAKCYLQQTQALEYCNVLFAVDKNYKQISRIQQTDVFSPEAILTADYDFIVIAVSKANSKSVLDDISQMDIAKERIIDGHTVLLNYISSFSQHGEDLVIMNMFKALDIENPSYIDVGASHPYKISNTALLYKNGSRGINVEANPELIAAFLNERPEDININVGVGVEPGVLPFYFVSAEIGTFSYDLALRWIDMHPNKNYKIEGVTEFPIITLDEIIDKYAHGDYPDFMDIDIEGLDYDVLERSDFSKGKPLIICAEITDIRMNEMMLGKGYKPYIKMGCNMIYVRENLMEKILGTESKQPK